MTSIVTVSPARNIWEQVKWKCQAYSSMFNTVILVHVILGFLTSEGTGSMSMGGSFVSFEARTYTLDGLFIYSVLLMLGMGWMLASGALSRDQFSIVTTNRMEVISTLLFTMVLAIFTVISALSIHCITIALEIIKTDTPFVLQNQFFSSTTLFAFAVGYFVRVVFQFSKIVFVLLAVVLFLAIRAYTISLWGVVFGASIWAIVGRSSLYIVLLWAIILVIRQRREVNR